MAQLVIFISIKNLSSVFYSQNSARVNWRAWWL